MGPCIKHKGLRLAYILVQYGIYIYICSLSNQGSTAGSLIMTAAYLSCSSVFCNRKNENSHVSFSHTERLGPKIRHRVGIHDDKAPDLLLWDLKSWQEWWCYTTLLNAFCRNREVHHYKCKRLDYWEIFDDEVASPEPLGELQSSCQPHTPGKPCSDCKPKPLRMPLCDC